MSDTETRWHMICEACFNCREFDNEHEAMLWQKYHTHDGEQGE